MHHQQVLHQRTEEVPRTAPGGKSCTAAWEPGEGPELMGTVTRQILELPEHGSHRPGMGAQRVVGI